MESLDGSGNCIDKSVAISWMLEEKAAVDTMGGGGVANLPHSSSFPIKVTN